MAVCVCACACVGWGGVINSSARVQTIKQPVGNCHYCAWAGPNWQPEDLSSWGDSKRE